MIHRFWKYFSCVLPFFSDTLNNKFHKKMDSTKFANYFKWFQPCNDLCFQFFCSQKFQNATQQKTQNKKTLKLSENDFIVQAPNGQLLCFYQTYRQKMCYLCVFLLSGSSPHRWGHRVPSGGLWQQRRPHQHRPKLKVILLLMCQCFPDIKSVCVCVHRDNWPINTHLWCLMNIWKPTRKCPVSHIHSSASCMLLTKRGFFFCLHTHRQAVSSHSWK